MSINQDTINNQDQKTKTTLEYQPTDLLNDQEDEDRSSFNNKTVADLYTEVRSMDTDKTLKQYD
jgi:hypothetical protein